MNDPLIRRTFHSTVLRSAHEDYDTVVIDELGLKNGAIRADIAVLNGKLVGYEIKGEKDSLTRLSSQVAAYSEVFEHAYLVVADKHLKKAKNQIPEWWGIYNITSDHRGIPCFYKEQSAKPNPGLNNFAIAQLLWKTEASAILQLQYGVCIKQRYTRSDLYHLLAEACTTTDLSEMVLQRLKARSDWRTSHLRPL